MGQARVQEKPDARLVKIRLAKIDCRIALTSLFRAAGLMDEYTELTYGVCVGEGAGENGEGGGGGGGGGSEDGGGKSGAWQRWLGETTSQLQDFINWARRQEDAMVDDPSE